MKSKLFFAYFLFLSNIIFSQNQTSKWMFGQYTGVDFMTTPPSVITGSMYSAEGCSSISDNAGNLLFYTNGVSVWDQSHAVMANGSGLLGHLSTTQSCLIVKQPGNTNLYYIFTLDDVGNPNGLRYSIVDMNLAVGMGSVTTKNVPLFSPSTEKLAAVKHCNKTDVWIMSHDWGSNVFRAYLLTPGGLVQNPVLSSIGTVHTGADQYAKIGSMKFSPNGKKLGICLRGGLDKVEMYNFDNATGTLSNLITLANMDASYGCEFSQDGSKFYITKAEVTPNYIGAIYQWDLCAGSPNAISSSSVLIDSGYDNYRAMQLGMDGKIYVAHIGSTPIGVINNPNNAGAACNYSNYGQAAGLCQLGLPNFVASYFKPPLPPFTFSLSCQTMSFSAGPYPSCDALGFNYTSVTWNFGDASSQANGFNTSHFYAPGTYTVLCILNTPCTSDTLQNTITVPAQLPVFNIAGQSSICIGANTTLGINNTANTYTWMPGSIVNNLALVSPTMTTVYSVTATHTLTGCTVSKTFTVAVKQCTTSNPTGFSEENGVANGILVYPNPSSTSISVSLVNKQLKNLLLDFKDVSGRKIKTVQLKNGEEQGIDIRDLPDGIYQLEVKDSDGRLIHSGKCIKQD